MAGEGQGPGAGGFSGRRGGRSSGCGELISVWWGWDRRGDRSSCCGDLFSIWWGCDVCVQSRTRRIESLPHREFVSLFGLEHAFRIGQFDDACDQRREKLRHASDLRVRLAGANSEYLEPSQWLAGSAAIDLYSGQNKTVA